MKRMLQQYLKCALLLTAGLAFTLPALGISLDAKIDKVLNKLDNVKSTGIATANKIDKMKPEGLGDMVTMVEGSLNKISPELLGELEAVTGQINALVAERAEKLAMFLDDDKQCSSGTPCDRFKGDLLSLLIKFNDAGTLAQVLTLPNLEPVNIINDSLLNLLEKAPGAVFMPLWVATKEGQVLSEMLDKIQLAGTISGEPAGVLPAHYSRPQNWNVVRTSMHHSIWSPTDTIGSGRQLLKVQQNNTTLADLMDIDCRLYPDDPAARYTAAARGTVLILNSHAFVAKVVKSIVETIPEDPDVEGKIWGWAGINFPGPPLKSAFTETFDWIGNLLGGAAARVEAKIESCEAAYNQMLIMKSTAGPDGIGSAWQEYKRIRP